VAEMPAVLPVPIEFRLPEGWFPARPDAIHTSDIAFAAVHPAQDSNFTTNITIGGDVLPDAVSLAEVAGESVEGLREVTDVSVVYVREVGTADTPGLTQKLAFTAVVNGIPEDLVQSQVYLVMSDTMDPRRRAVIRLVLTTTAATFDEVLGDFQDFIRSVRPDTKTGAA
jgi:hypothetical protein